jgi:hypothetical protein
MTAADRLAAPVSAAGRTVWSKSLSRSSKQSIVAALFLHLTAAAALAQDQAEPARRPILLVGVAYEVPLRTTAGLGILIPFGQPEIGDHGVLSYPGLLMEAGVGTGGRRVAFGLASRVKDTNGPVLFGADALLSLRWTGSSPRNASPDSTYLGVEAGLMLIAIRFSVGAARRIAGLDGPKRTIFTWSMGVQTGW